MIKKESSYFNIIILILYAKMMLKTILIIQPIIAKVNLHLTMFMMMTPNKVKFMTQLQGFLSHQLSKDIMQLYLLMDKQGLGKLLQCRALNIIFMMNNAELFQELLKTFLDIFKVVKINKPNLWSEHHISKFIMRLSVIY